MAVWARNAERWDALPKLWTLCAETSEFVPADFYAVFAELPTEARGAQPVLTWISAIAQAESVVPKSRRTEVFLDRIILDSALLHADWASRADTDIALEAGILRMVGQRHLPPSGGPLEAAWRTKQQLDEFVDARSRAGQPPTPNVHSLFRLMSARLSIMRADLTGAVVESHWGGVLAVSEPAVKLAAAIESLARSLAGQVRAADDLAVPTVRRPDSPTATVSGASAREPRSATSCPGPAISSRSWTGTGCAALSNRSASSWPRSRASGPDASAWSPWLPRSGVTRPRA